MQAPGGPPRLPAAAPGSPAAAGPRKPPTAAGGGATPPGSPAKVATARGSPLPGTWRGPVGPPGHPLGDPHWAEMQQLLEMAKSLLGFPLRPDGPPLAFDFDAPPTKEEQQQGPRRKRPAPEAAEEDGEEEGPPVVAPKRPALQGPVGPPFSRPGPQPSDFHLPPHHPLGSAYPPPGPGHLNSAAMAAANRQALLYNPRVMNEAQRAAVARERQEELVRAQAARGREMAERRAEKERKMEEKKKEKQRENMLNQLERQLLRQRMRAEDHGGEDTEVAVDEARGAAFMAWQRATAHVFAANGQRPIDWTHFETLPAPQQEQLLKPHMQPVRWPPVTLEPALPPGLDPGLAHDLLSVWGFLVSFPTFVCLPPITLELLLEALVQGQASALLGAIHIQLLRLLQLDIEEAYASGVLTAGGNVNFSDRAVLTSAQRLVESWAWGLDVDVWRAHVNLLTWPEVLRQVALACGAAGKRSKQRADASGKIGIEGEDIIEACPEEGRLRLQLPSRFALGTVKEAAWRVLSEASAEGMDIKVVARRIQQRGLRDLSTSKTPEASVAGALSRDAVFVRVKPATYALSSIVNHHKRMAALKAAAEAVATPAGEAEAGSGAEVEQAEAERQAQKEAGQMPPPPPRPPADASAAEQQEMKAEAAGPPAADDAAGAGSAAMANGSSPVKQEPAAAAADGVKQEHSTPVVKQEEPVAASTAAAVVKEPSSQPSGDTGAGSAPADVAGPSSNAAPGAEGAATDAASGPGSADGAGGSGVTVVERMPGEAADAAGEEDAAQAAPAAEEADHPEGEHPEGEHHEGEHHEGEGGSEDEGDSDEEGEGQGATGAARWAAALLAQDYDLLPLGERLGALRWLCNQVLEGPGVRTELREREDRGAALRKQIAEELQALDKRKRLEVDMTRAFNQLQTVNNELMAAIQRGNVLPTMIQALQTNVAAKHAAFVAAEHNLLKEGGPLGQAAGGTANGGPPGGPRPAARDPAADLEVREQRIAAMVQFDQGHAIRMEPLGYDRQHNRYWLWSAGVGGTEGVTGDTGTSRIWVEMADSGALHLLHTVEQLEALLEGLLQKGTREGSLYAHLTRLEPQLRASMPGKPLALPPGYEQVVALADNSHHGHGNHSHRPSSSSSPAPEQQPPAQEAAGGGADAPDSNGSTPQPVALGLLAAGPGDAPATVKQWVLRGPLYAELATSNSSSSANKQQQQQPQQPAQPATIEQLAEAAVGCSNSLAEAALKVQMLSLHAAVAPRLSAAASPAASSFDAAAWAAAVQGASSFLQLRACLAQLEVALSNTPGLLSKDWAPTPVLVKGAFLSSTAEVNTAIHEAAEAAGEDKKPPGGEERKAAAGPGGEDRKAAAAAAAATAAAAAQMPTAARGQVLEAGAGAGEHLSWLPATFAALSLRLATLDAAVVYEAGKRAAREWIAPYKYALRPAPLVFPPSIADVVKMQVHDPAQHATHSVTPQRAGVLLDQVAAAATPNLAGPAASGPWQPALRVYFKESLVTGSDKPGRWALTTWPPFPEQVFLRALPQNLALPRAALVAAVEAATAAGSLKYTPKQLRLQREGATPEQVYAAGPEGAAAAAAAKAAAAVARAAAAAAASADDSGPEEGVRDTPPPGGSRLRGSSTGAGSSAGEAGEEVEAAAAADVASGSGGEATGQEPAVGGPRKRKPTAKVAEKLGEGRRRKAAASRDDDAPLPPRAPRNNKRAAAAAAAATWAEEAAPEGLPTAVALPIRPVLAAPASSSEGARGTPPVAQDDDEMEPMVPRRKRARGGKRPTAALRGVSGSPSVDGASLGGWSTDKEGTPGGWDSSAPLRGLKRHQVVRLNSAAAHTPPQQQQQQAAADDDEDLDIIV